MHFSSNLSEAKVPKYRHCIGFGTRQFNLQRIKIQPHKLYKYSFGSPIEIPKKAMSDSLQIFAELGADTLQNYFIDSMCCLSSTSAALLCSAAWRIFRNNRHKEISFIRIAPTADAKSPKCITEPKIRIDFYEFCQIFITMSNLKP